MDGSTASALRGLRIQTPADVRPAAERLRDIAEDLAGFRVALCHNIAVHEAMVDASGALLATDTFGWTDDEADRWWRTPRLALDSPLPTACRYESEPFWCNAQGFRTSTPNPLLATIDMTNYAERSLTPAAIVVPVHLPFGQIGAGAFTPRERERTDLTADFARHGDLLGLLTRVFLSGYSQVMAKTNGQHVAPLLSKREVECLRWIAIGKTDVEIGLIMARSPATIQFHVHNASQKLGAVNRSQALFRAAQLGYISPQR